MNLGDLYPKDIDYQEVIQEYNNNNTDGIQPISYICAVHQNQSQHVSVEYFYDLVHTNCRTRIDNADSSSSNTSITSSVSTIPLQIADIISIRFVQEIAELWNIIPIGEACISPNTMFEDVWLVGITTVTSTSTPITYNATKTRIVSDFGCQTLTPNTTSTNDDEDDECCHVIRSEIIFRPSGGYNVSKLISYVHNFIDTTTSDEGGMYYYRTAIIVPQFVEGTTMNDEARNNLKEPNRTKSAVTPPSAASNVNAITQQSRDEEITLTGGILIASFITVLFGVFIVLVRRNRIAKSRSSQMYNNPATMDDTFREKGDDDDDDIRVTVVNDPNYNSFPVRRQLTCQSCVSYDNDGDAVESELLEEYGTSEQLSPKQYAFDLGQSMKMKVMGTYAPTTIIPVVAPYPLSVSGSTSNVAPHWGSAANNNNHPPFVDVDLSGCDSEAEDSWAQTDGTVGSIEERLEEITAEI